MEKNPDKKVHGTKSGFLKRVDGTFVVVKERPEPPQSVPELPDAESSTGMIEVRGEGEDVAKQNDDSAIDSQADVN